MDLGLPTDLTWYKLLTDWGSLIGGGFALIAGAVAYIGARQAATKQIGAMARKDRMQARGIVVGVYPELLELQIDHERASKAVEQWPSMQTMLAVTLVPVIRSAKIELTPLMARNVDNFFLVEPGGASLQQVASFTLQYNGLVDNLAKQVADNPHSFDPPAHQQAVSGNLKAIGMALADAVRETAPIHHEATSQ